MAPPPKTAALVRAPEAPTTLAVWTQAQVELIKRTVCPSDTTDDELKLFLHVAQASGLDPLTKQIHLTKRNGRMTIISGIDGLQARATRNADYEGLLHGVVCAKDVVRYDAASGAVVEHTYNPFADRGAIVGAWATVKRRGRLPFTATVRFAEFNQPNSPTWKAMPTVMIDKVARSTALRMAYPEQFSSVLEEAEADRVEDLETRGHPPELSMPTAQPQPPSEAMVDAQPTTAPAPEADPFEPSEEEKIEIALNEAQSLADLKPTVPRIKAVAKDDPEAGARLREKYNVRYRELSTRAA